MDEVIMFDKSLQERLQEYMDVFSGYDVLSISQIKKEWSFYLELSLDPCGWQAIWKIPRLTCEQYKISYPTIVLVYVEHVDCKTLEAVVKILAVQDDISLPDKHIVNLIQLWPTKDQDRTVGLSVNLTANSLDMLRFFYKYLFMPWDYEEDDTSDWLSNHLKSRLKLFYDMRNGVIPHSVSEHLSNLIIEAQRLQAKKEQLEMQLDSDDELDDGMELTAGNTEDRKVQALMDLHVRIIEIRGEVEILENPLMRNVILKRQQDLTPKSKHEPPTFWLISDKASIDDHIAFLNQAKSYYPNEIVKFTSSLASTLEYFNPNDTIVLNKARHQIRSVGGLENGGVLRGIYGKTETVVTSANEDVMLDFSGEIRLENLTIDATVSQCGILVRRGKVTMANCKLVGDGESSTHQGIIVLSGSQLDLVDCDISRFSTGVVGNSGSKITMKGCEIHDVNFGIKVFDNCLISAHNSTFHHCREYGLCVETNELNENSKVGSFEVLQITPDIRVEDLNGNNNGKGDVVINQKPRIKPVLDLFSSPEFNSRDERKDSSSEEEMEVTDNTLNNTIIENINCKKISPNEVS